MNVWQRLRALAAPDAMEPEETFSLADRGHERPQAEVKTIRRRLRIAGAASAALGQRIERLAAVQPTLAGAASDSVERLQAVGDISPSLDENLRHLKILFKAPTNADIIIREIRIGMNPPRRAALVFMEGMADRKVINTDVMAPLMLLANLDREKVEKGTPLIDIVLARLLPAYQAEAKPTMEEVMAGVLYGDTAVVVDGANQIIMVDTKGFPLRSVTEPKQELVIRGPMDAFNESVRTNVALVRRRLKDPRLITEILTIGTVSRTTAALMYLEGIANPKLVAEAKRRLQKVQVDFVPESGVLEQLIEDQPVAVFPQVFTTERPDRTAAYISEGHVALITDNSPFALVVPVTWWTFFQTAEDYYIRWPYGTLLRWLRLGALAITILSGALYVAAVNYHPAILPTSLLLAIAGTREIVPFPAIFELLAMELSFELVREAGIRIPSVIGPTIGIVGALILGQAAVEARLFSPIIIFVVAISGLASFAIPNYTSAYGLRMLRLLLILITGILGMLGLALALLTLIFHVAGLRSFGVPFMSPLAPPRPAAPDVLIRGFMFQMEQRPGLVRPLDPTRQPKVARRWDPLVPDYLRRRRQRHRPGGEERE